MIRKNIRKFLNTLPVLAAVVLVLSSFVSCSGGTDYVGGSSGVGTKTAESYTVTFETNGGSTVAAQTVESGKTATEPAVPAKDGYDFAGWFSDSALTSVFSFATKITANTTLYAKWISASTPTYTVNFETNGGSTVASQTVEVNGTATKPTDPEKSGRTFNDWYASNAYNATKYDFTAAVTENTTIYARWWTSEVFISGRNITIGNITASDHEVTQSEYETYCKYGGTNTPSATYGVGTNYPAYYVSWYDALVYCNRRSIAEHLTPCYTIDGKTDPAQWPDIGSDGAGKYCGPSSNNDTWNAATCDFTANGWRLPTEAEWEWLARGGDSEAEAWEKTYAGSDTVDDVAWSGTNSGSKTHEVKQKGANSKNLYDMSGNVFEWCWDWCGTIEADTPAAGASSGSDRVVRGGAWGFPASHCAVSFRHFFNPNVRFSELGFRVVRTAE